MKMRPIIPISCVSSIGAQSPLSDLRLWKHRDIMTDLTSIQLYLWNLVPTGYMKLRSRSGLSLALVTREQHGVSGNVSTGYVTFVLANSRFVSRSRTVPKESNNLNLKSVAGRLGTNRLAP